MNSPRLLGLALGLATSCFVSLGCGSPLVGLECREGYTRCGDACYDLRSDPAHCGSCELACGAAESCLASACLPSPGGGGAPEDGAVPGDGSVDGSAGGGDGGSDGATPDDASTPPDGGSEPSVPCTGPGSPTDCACDLGQLKCGLDCVDALTDPSNCGGCGHACAALEVCAAGACAPRCTAPLTLCGQLCVNLDEDTDNCGGCGNACTMPGAACVDQTCVGSAVGHTVVIGHDMTAARAPMRTLVGNAVFLVRKSPVRVLVYEADTSVASRTGVADAIRLSAQNLGRMYAIEQATADQVSLQLNGADVFVIDPQQAASDDALKDLGGNWYFALRSFLRRGGVVLLFDAADASSPNAGTYQILGPLGAQLLPVFRRTMSFTSRRLELQTFGDAIAAGLPDAYVSDGLSAAFELTLPPYLGIPLPVRVVRDPPSTQAVVIHLAGSW